MSSNVRRIVQLDELVVKKAIICLFHTLLGTGFIIWSATNGRLPIENCLVSERRRQGIVQLHFYEKRRWLKLRLVEIVQSTEINLVPYVKSCSQQIWWNSQVNFAQWQERAFMYGFKISLLTCINAPSKKLLFSKISFFPCSVKSLEYFVLLTVFDMSKLDEKVSDKCEWKENES